MAIYKGNTLIAGTSGQAVQKKVGDSVTYREINNDSTSLKVSFVEGADIPQTLTITKTGLDFDGVDITSKRVKSINLDSEGGTSWSLTGGNVYYGTISSGSKTIILATKSNNDYLSSSVGFAPGEVAILNISGAGSPAFIQNGSPSGQPAIIYHDGYSSVTPSSSTNNVVSYCILYDGRNWLINCVLYKPDN